MNNLNSQKSDMTEEEAEEKEDARNGDEPILEYTEFRLAQILDIEKQILAEQKMIYLNSKTNDLTEEEADEIKNLHLHQSILDMEKMALHEMDQNSQKNEMTEEEEAEEEEFRNKTILDYYEIRMVEILDMEKMTQQQMMNLNSKKSNEITEEEEEEAKEEDKDLYLCQGRLDREKRALQEMYLHSKYIEMTETEAEAVINEHIQQTENLARRMNSVRDHVKKEKKQRKKASILAKREKLLPPQRQKAGYRYDIEEYGGWGFGGKYNNPGRFDLEMSFNERKRFYDNNLERYGLLPVPKEAFYMYGCYGERNEDYSTKDYIFYRPDGETEGKAIEWFESNGFFQVAREPTIIWSGPWYYRHFPEEKKEKEKNCGSSPAINNRKLLVPSQISQRK